MNRPKAPDITQDGIEDCLVLASEAFKASFLSQNNVKNSEVLLYSLFHRQVRIS